MLIKRKQKQLRRAKSLTLNISLSYEPVREMCLQPPQISFPLVLFCWSLLFPFSFIRSCASSCASLVFAEPRLVLPPPLETALRYWLLRLEQINYKQLLGVENLGPWSSFFLPQKRGREMEAEGLWAANHWTVESREPGPRFKVQIQDENASGATVCCCGWYLRDYAIRTDAVSRDASFLAAFGEEIDPRCIGLGSISSIPSIRFRRVS